MTLADAILLAMIANGIDHVDAGRELGLSKSVIQRRLDHLKVLFDADTTHGLIGQAIRNGAV